MKILRLLNRKSLSIIFILFFSIIAKAEEQPIDIWNIDKKSVEENISTDDENSIDNEELKNITEEDIFSMQSQINTTSIELDHSLSSKKINIYGLYDPEDYDLDIDMWLNSNGNQLKKKFSQG